MVDQSCCKIPDRPMQKKKNKNFAKPRNPTHTHTCDMVTVASHCSQEQHVGLWNVVCIVAEFHTLPTCLIVCWTASMASSGRTRNSTHCRGQKRNTCCSSWHRRSSAGRHHRDRRLTARTVLWHFKPHQKQPPVARLHCAAWKSASTRRLSDVCQIRVCSFSIVFFSFRSFVFRQYTHT